CHLRCQERREHLRCFHPRAMIMTTREDLGHVKTPNLFGVLGKTAKKTPQHQKFPQIFGGCGRCGRCGGWDANMRQPPFREYYRPRVAQSDQRCPLQRGKTLTWLIRQHCDKDRGALWRPCDVPGHALWSRQLVRKRSGVPHTLGLWK